MRYSYRHSNPDPDFVSMLMDAFFTSGYQAKLHPLLNLSTEEQVFKAMEALIQVYNICMTLDGLPNPWPIKIQSIDDAYSYKPNWSPLADASLPSGHKDRWTPVNEYIVLYPFSLFGEEVDDQYTSGSSTRPMRSFGLRNEFHLRKIADAIATSVKTLEKAYFNKQAFKIKN